jgi:NDP-sugar pyrophosphorylase family protein
MAKINHALILAAGRGVRMRPLTDVIPKALIPHNGSTLIANGIEKIRKTIPNIHITVGYKGELIASHVVQNSVSSIFNTSGKGNAWWLYNTLLKNLNEPLFVLTCDNVTDIDFDKIAEDYFAKDSPACMAVPVVPVKGLEGDYIFRDGSVITRLSREEKSDLYCSGIQVVHPGKINAMTTPTEDFNVVWSQLMAKRAFHCSDVHPDKWYTVDNLIQLEELYQTQVPSK